MRILSLAFLIIIFTFTASAQRRASPCIRPELRFSCRHALPDRPTGGRCRSNAWLYFAAHRASLHRPSTEYHVGDACRFLGVTDADGVKFYKVAIPPTSIGWVQSDALFGKFRAGDEKRLFELVQALDGFDQIEAAAEFFQLLSDLAIQAGDPPSLWRSTRGARREQAVEGGE